MKTGDDKAVSHLLEYVMILGMISTVTVAQILMVTISLDNRARVVGNAITENIASNVADAIMNAATMKETYSNSNYSRILDIPLYIIEPHRSYYIEVGEDTVYVNSTDGIIHATASLYNTSNTYAIQISGKVYSSYNKINISTTKTPYVYRFNFGPENTFSTGDLIMGYKKITDNSLTPSQFPFFNTMDDWKNDPIWGGWEYCTRINVTNPTNKSIQNYQVLVKLNASNFDYSSVNQNASDLRFVYNKSGNPIPIPLNYWIETWKIWNTSTSRIWVKIPEIQANSYRYIYMFHGNKTASPPSECNGSKTFLFFDDFSDNKLNLENWIYSNLDNGEYNVRNGLLILKNNSAVKSKKINISLKGILEAKARSVSDPIRDASIFVKHNTTGTKITPCVFVFSSGNFSPLYGSSRNESLALLYKNSTQGNDPLLGNAGNNRANYIPIYPLDEEWKRLVFIVNDTDHIVIRYKYEDNSMEGYAIWSYSDAQIQEEQQCKDGRFGLCTLHDDVEAHYDWVFLRKFAMNTSENANTTEEQIPTAQLGGTVSQKYFWEIGLYSKLNENVEDPLSRGSIYSTSSKTFTIKGLEANQEYTVVFVIGGGDSGINSLSIKANDVPVFYSLNVDADEFKKLWFTETSDSNGELRITFECNNYWNICWLTVEEGRRVITLQGGE